MSPKTAFAPPRAIRGGVPVCFPQFGMLGPMQVGAGMLCVFGAAAAPRCCRCARSTSHRASTIAAAPRLHTCRTMQTQHGFARNQEWQVVADSGDAATLALGSNDTTLALWPHPFRLELAVSGCWDVNMERGGWVAGGQPSLRVAVLQARAAAPRGLVATATHACRCTTHACPPAPPCCAGLAAAGRRAAPGAARKEQRRRAARLHLRAAHLLFCFRWVGAVAGLPSS